MPALLKNSPFVRPSGIPLPSREGNAAGKSRNVTKDILKTAKHQDDFS
jgi:hypothetical protein